MDHIIYSYIDKDLFFRGIKDAFINFHQSARTFIDSLNNKKKGYIINFNIIFNATD